MAASASFEESYTATVDRLHGHLFVVTGDLHAAEEIVQEAFTRAAMRWAHLRDYDVPEAWVRRVAMNLAADRARSLRRQARALLKLGPPPAVPAVSVETLALVQALRTLPTRQRQAIVLHYLADPRRGDRPGAGCAQRDRERPACPWSPGVGGQAGEPAEVFDRRMNELRERLQEAADAAVRESRHPTAAALVRRGRRRRRRLAGGTAALLVLGCSPSQPAPAGRPCWRRPQRPAPARSSCRWARPPARWASRWCSTSPVRWPAAGR